MWAKRCQMLGPGAVGERRALDLVGGRRGAPEEAVRETGIASPSSLEPLLEVAASKRWSAFEIDAALEAVSHARRRRAAPSLQIDHRVPPMRAWTIDFVAEGLHDLRRSREGRSAAPRPRLRGGSIPRGGYRRSPVARRRIPGAGRAIGRRKDSPSATEPPPAHRRRQGEFIGGVPMKPATNRLAGRS